MVGPRYPLAPIRTDDPTHTLRDHGALGVIELRSIASGILVLDAMIKEAPVAILTAEATSPGKYLILLGGAVEEVSRSLAAGIALAGEDLLDDLLLPDAHPELTARLAEKANSAPEWKGNEVPALGILETYGAPSLLGAVDTALKTGETTLVDLHLLGGIGGKATGLLAGDVESVRVGIDAGAAHAESRGTLARQVVIPRPDAELVRHLDRRNA